MSTLKRSTRETQILCEVRRGTGTADVKIGDRFLAHMVETLARYAALDVSIEAVGDLRHHLVEDVAITLGLALKDEIPEKAARYGWAVIPMDESLAEAAVDVGGRSYYVGDLPSRLYDHFLHSLATNLGATLHVRVLRGEDRHHRVEAAVKAVGLALRQALSEGDQVFSTKGSVMLERLD
ncbi:MAG: imidazoleglycerol-phosphate dehydratase [Gemmatimonadota bacterium]|jgi:imidazoleglycerol-phosphate dehydratase